ncbi:2-C-methyl-D-erythritol 4-phosphate cytidylyltransferase, partial [Bradyrhizobium sp. STM 3843]|uniref:2-C-methyl-D-erythritol 4-phosphate cytidylyltransferase n=1 Tax=Bradyrhizobium sp. STM 3843 TaxID=551947 RepID=UPI00055B4E4A
MTSSQRTAAILVAAGRGLRAGGGGPKQYRMIGGRTVIHRALAAFADHPEIDIVQPVVNPDDTDVFSAAV